ncbi:MAG: hypothetical protein QXO02_07125 [Thermofilaceae archaeon]
MVELKRGIPKKVVLYVSASVRYVLTLDESIRRELPFPGQVSFEDGRVGYFLLAEAGFPYLAYALFSHDKPRDERERRLFYDRLITADIEDVLRSKFPYFFYIFTVRPFSLLDAAGDEVQRFYEWAEKLTLEEVKAMLDKLEELEKQQRVKPEIIYDSPEWCLRSIKNLAALLRWALDERTRFNVSLEVTVSPRRDEPHVY